MRMKKTEEVGGRRRGRGNYLPHIFARSKIKTEALRAHVLHAIGLHEDYGGGRGAVDNARGGVGIYVVGCRIFAANKL